MKFNQLRDFVSVAEKGSLRGAARALGLAQPAITRSIQELEHSLGAQLFIREARGVVLTPIGEDFLIRAMTILGEVRRAREAVQQHQHGVAGELSVGLSIVAHLGLMPRVLPAFRRRYPQVQLRLIEGFLPTLEGDLRNGLLDLYVGPVPEEQPPPDLQATKLFDNRRVVAGRKGHPMSGARHWSELGEAGWLSTSITRDAAAELSAAFKECGLPPPRVSATCQSALSLATVLLHSDLLAMLPVQWLDSPFLSGWIEEIRLDHRFAAPPIMMVNRAGLGLTPAGEHFAHLVHSAARDISLRP